jgi:hypothetical protein
MPTDNPCPCGECELKEYRIDGYPVGIRYGCVGGKTDDAMYAGPYRAWVCRKSWRALVQQRAEKKLPDVDKDLVRHTIQIRASMRPDWMCRYGGAT